MSKTILSLALALSSLVCHSQKNDWLKMPLQKPNKDTINDSNCNKRWSDLLNRFVAQNIQINGNFFWIDASFKECRKFAKNLVWSNNHYLVNCGCKCRGDTAKQPIFPIYLFEENR